MQPLVAATVQAYAVPGKVLENARTAARLARRAADGGAELVVLPELFLSAYNPPALEADPDCFLTADEHGVIDDPRLDALRDTGILTIIGSAVSYPDGRRTCSSLVIDRTGRITAAYDKQHLCGPAEKALFSPGTRGATLVAGDWRFGLAVCYDGCFPEHGRAAVNDGVHGYLVPAGYVEGSQHRRDLYYAARALDNTMYVIFSNSSGGEAPWRLNGGAAIYDPEGRCLGRGADEGEEIIMATLDPAQLALTRSNQTMLTDRHLDQGGERAFWTVS
jgi:predicted amidohydrolase